METPKYKELQDLLSTQTDEKGRIETMLNIAEEVKSFDVDRAIQMADEILTKSKSIAYPLGTGKSLCLKGFCLRLKGEYNSALAELKEALGIAKKLKDRNLEAIAFYYMGNVYRDLGDFANVLVNYEKALAINEELGDEFYQSVILSSISNLLYDLNDFDSALEYALKCLPIFERAHNINSILNIYNTLGNIYFKKENFTEALHYFEENLNRSEPDTSAYVLAESGLGKVYYKMQNFEDARKYLINSLRTAQEIDNAEIQIICQYYLGRLYMDESNYRQALQNLNIAFTMAEQYMRRQDMMSVHEMLSALYDKMGDIPKAFHHLKTFQNLKEEIFKQTILNELRNLQVRQQIELAQKEKEVAERTAFLKHQFMANMSHEIRTPMNAIVGMTRLLLTKDPKQEQLRYLNAIQLSADNLLVIINDILDLSKIEAGKIIIEHTDFSIREIIQSVRDMLMLKAEEKHIDFKITIDNNIPKKLIGDPTRLNQVLINLAGNAIKFTEKGYVEIKITLHQTDSEHLWLAFEVIDTGIGIAPDYVDTIFDSFTQAGTDVARKFGGTGLGLTISRQLVGLMGGDINVKSELQKGTVFTTIIPFEKAEVQDEICKSDLLDTVSMSKLNNLKVLLVEDNEFNRMVAEDTLKEALPGICIDIAVDGAEAVSRLQKESYDIVLMDIQMPVMDGMTATKIIRSTFKEPEKNIKIIAMTANVLQEDVKQYLDAGMDAYVSKPFQIDELLLKIDSVIGKDQLIANKPKNETNGSGTTVPVPPVLPEFVTDMKFLKQFTNSNNEKMQKYIGMFLENAPKLLGTIDKALETKDYPTIKIAAHSLKPQLSYMGIKDEYSNILLIEHSAGGNGHYEGLPKLIENLKYLCIKAFEELKMGNK